MFFGGWSYPDGPSDCAALGTDAAQTTNVPKRQFQALLMGRCILGMNGTLAAETVLEQQKSDGKPREESTFCTDGHLFELARKNSMRLVTFDQGIPNALRIG